VIAFSLLPSITPLGGGEPPGIRSIVEGFRFLVHQRVILGCFLVDTVAMVFGMPSALFPAIAIVQLHAGAAVVGYLYAAPAAGALVAALFAGWYGHLRRQGVVIVVAATSWGVAIALFGFATSLWLALLLLAFAGAADAVSAVLRNRIMFALTPDALQGRVSAAYLAQVTSAPRLGNLEAGSLAALTSIRFSIVSGGILCVAGCLLLVAAIPSLIRYEAKPGA
jgi:MFS family permease